MRQGIATFLLLVSIQTPCHAAPNPDGKFTVERAEAYSKLSLACMDQAFPYKSDHVVSSGDDVKAQKEFHPAFYGCFDWHSAVHGHWALLRIIDLFPDISNRSEIEKRLDNHFDPKLIAREAETFRRDDQKRFERAFGYSWFLRLILELQASKNPNRDRWLKALSPLETVIRDRFLDYLKVFDFPIRRGVHENSAFALNHAFDYATVNHDQPFVEAISTTAKKFYSRDQACPLAYEPEGDDFISPCLAEADLMRRVLPKKEFLIWFDKFWPKKVNHSSQKFFTPLTPSHINDAKAVHLVGLDFYRAWTMASIAEALPVADPRRKLLLESSQNHARTGEKLAAEPGYEGTHWLASFAIYHFTAANK